MTEHVLYVNEDFDHSDDNVIDSCTYKAVVEGGLGVCKHCGAYESGLDEYPTCEEWRNRVED